MGARVTRIAFIADARPLLCKCGCGEPVSVGRGQLWKKGHHVRRHADPANFDPVVAKRNEYYWRAYRLTVAQLDAMIAAQEGLCAICGEAPRPHQGIGRLWCVDHNHTTGQIRELLCRQCNSGIGSLRESVRVLRSAIAYLEKHSS
jgi:hypothetical protein